MGVLARPGTARKVTKFERLETASRLSFTWRRSEQLEFHLGDWTESPKPCMFHSSNSATFDGNSHYRGRHFNSGGMPSIDLCSPPCMLVGIPLHPCSRQSRPVPM